MVLHGKLCGRVGFTGFKIKAVSINFEAAFFIWDLEFRIWDLQILDLQILDLQILDLQILDLRFMISDL